MLAQHFHHAAVGRHVVVARVDVGRGAAIGRLEDHVPAIGGCLVGAYDAKIACLRVLAQHVADSLSLHACRLGLDLPAVGNWDTAVAMAIVTLTKVKVHRAPAAYGLWCRVGSTSIAP